MPIIEQTNQAKMQAYQKFVCSVENTHFMQDPRWTKVHDNLKPEFVTVEENGQIIIAATVYVRPIALGYCLLYVNRGPVAKQHNLKTLHMIIMEMQPLVKKYKALAIRFDPNWLYNEEEEKVFKAAGLNVRGKGFSKRDLVMARRSMILYLKERNMAELMAMFRTSKRRDTNKSLRMGLTVEEGFTKEHLDQFMQILEITCIRDGIEHRPREFFEKIAQNFTHDEARLYMVKKDDKWLAGAIGMNYGGHLYYYHSGSNNECRNCYPNNFLQYQLIEWAIEAHCHTYDMGGIVAENASDGLYLFKSGYCNEEMLQEYYGEIDYPCKPIIYKGFLLAYTLMQKYRVWKIQKSLKREK